MSADLLKRPKVRPRFLTERHWTVAFAGVFLDVDGDVTATAVFAEIKRAAWERSRIAASEPDTPMHFYETERFPR